MQLLLNIKDNEKGNLFISFIKTLDYIKLEEINEGNDTELQDWQKKILDERLKDQNYISEEEF